MGTYPLVADFDEVFRALYPQARAVALRILSLDARRRGCGLGGPGPRPARLEAGGPARAPRCLDPQGHHQRGPRRRPPAQPAAAPKRLPSMAATAETHRAAHDPRGGPDRAAHAASARPSCCATSPGCRSRRSRLRSGSRTTPPRSTCSGGWRACARALTITQEMSLALDCKLPIRRRDARASPTCEPVELRPLAGCGFALAGAGVAAVVLVVATVAVLSSTRRSSRIRRSTPATTAPVASSLPDAESGSAGRGRRWRRRR